MSTKHGKTLRLHMPQWQGGNVHDYYLGSKLLAWLAPPADGPVETIPVTEIASRAARACRIRAARPSMPFSISRISPGGGDCLVDLAPMAYLNTRYGGTLGVLWVDAHPDVLTPKDFAQGNAQVLGALLGKGDSDLVSEVNTPIKTSHIKYAGLDAWMPVEGAVINTFGLRRAGSDSLAETSAPVLNWIADEGIAHLAIHFDVDVLDPAKFGPVLFNKPGAPADAWTDVPRGRMLPDQVVRLLQDVAATCDVVGLAIAEYMPWEAIAMHNMLRKLPLLAG